MSLKTSAASRGLVAVLAASLALAAGGCSKDEPAEAAKTPEQVMELAQSKLDETSGLDISLTTEDLPEGVKGLVDATGTATDAPAFDGTITVIFAGTEVAVPVVAVDGKVWVQIPLTTGWQDVDPGDYGAPDPADLVTADKGFASLLPATTSLEKGESSRGGQDNKEILTVYTGTVPGDAMKKVIPSTAGDAFEATYLVSDNGELREASFTGVFYKDSESMTYSVTFENYGTTKSISAP